MNRPTVKIMLGVGAAALVAGLSIGGAMGASDDFESAESSRPAVVSTTDPEGRPATILGRLTDGSTYGYWYGDTSDSQRPDYTRVKLKGGRVGYLRVEQVWPAEDPRMFESSDAGRALRAEHMAKQIQPDSKGEVWAPAYADDGRTVIGQVLVYTVGESSEG